MWMFYSIALFLFVLGIPADQVSLRLLEGFVEMDSSKIDTVNALVNTGEQDWFPVGYLDYFKQRRAHCLREEIRFHELLPAANILAVLDTSNAPRAVGVFSGILHSGTNIDPNTRRKKIANFDKTAMFSIDAVCDQNDITRAFRIGYEGQDPAENNDQLFSKMSPPVGDPVTVYLFTAIKALVDGGIDEGPDLSDLFKETYGELNTTFLPGEKVPTAYSSSLETLAQLIKSGVVPMNLQAYDCGMFSQRGNWFLTSERDDFFVLTPDEADLAPAIVAYVEEAVLSWHAGNSKDCSFEQSGDSMCAWSRLLSLLGPFRHLLADKQHDVNFTSGAITLSDDGIPFQALAESCHKMPKVMVDVHQLVASDEVSRKV